MMSNSWDRDASQQSGFPSEAGQEVSEAGKFLSADPLQDGLVGEPVGGLSDNLPQGGAELLSEVDLLQLDVSMMVDGELQEEQAARTLERLEALPDCREFFEHILGQVRMHQALADPDSLAERYREFTGGRVPKDLETKQLVHRLASIFYQVGKAYALTSFDPDWRQRVFDRAASIEQARNHGRGFIDGIAARQQRGGDPTAGGFGPLDWHTKRHLLNGLLERIERPADKAKRMLEECLRVEPDYDPAHLYLGFLEIKAGLRLRAAKRFEYVFENAIDPGNKGHAAMQLGKLYAAEGEYRTALTWFRWIGLSGLSRLDERFYPARFNTGLCYANLGRIDRALGAFRDMLDRHPGRVEELKSFFARSPALRQCIDAQAGFGDRLLRLCPELFTNPGQSPVGT